VGAVLERCKRLKRCRPENSVSKMMFTFSPNIILKCNFILHSLEKFYEHYFIRSPSSLQRGLSFGVARSRGRSDSLAGRRSRPGVVGAFSAKMFRLFWQIKSSSFDIKVFVTRR